MRTQAAARAHYASLRLAFPSGSRTFIIEYDLKWLAFIAAADIMAPLSPGRKPGAPCARHGAPSENPAVPPGLKPRGSTCKPRGSIRTGEASPGTARPGRGVN